MDHNQPAMSLAETRAWLAEEFPEAEDHERERAISIWFGFIWMLRHRHDAPTKERPLYKRRED